MRASRFGQVREARLRRTPALLRLDVGTALFAAACLDAHGSYPIIDAVQLADGVELC